MEIAQCKFKGSLLNDKLQKQDILIKWDFQDFMIIWTKPLWDRMICIIWSATDNGLFGIIWLTGKEKMILGHNRTKDD